MTSAKNAFHAGSSLVSTINVHAMLRRECGGIRVGRQRRDAARRRRTFHVIRNFGEIEELSGRLVEYERLIELSPPAVVLLDRMEDRRLPRRFRKVIASPLPHDAFGQRGVRRLCNEMQC